MKNLIAVTMLFSFVIQVQLFSQVDPCNDFNEFKSFFNYNNAENETNKHSKEIPIDLATKVLGDEIINEYVVSISAYDIIVEKKNTNLIIEVMYPQGGYSSSYEMISFSPDCRIIMSKSIGSTRLNNNGGSQSVIRIINDSLIEVKKERVKFDSEGEAEKVNETEYSYFVLNGQGFYSVEISKISKGRVYPKASAEIINLSELMEMNKEDLDIMRNEIFADHGYIFNTEKWKEYFNKQGWYKPCRYEVSNKLTLIEKINIERILEVSLLK